MLLSQFVVPSGYPDHGQKVCMANPWLSIPAWCSNPVYHSVNAWSKQPFAYENMTNATRRAFVTKMLVNIGVQFLLILRRKKTNLMIHGVLKMGEPPKWRGFTTMIKDDLLSWFHTISPYGGTPRSDLLFITFHCYKLRKSQFSEIMWNYHNYYYYYELL